MPVYKNLVYLNRCRINTKVNHVQGSLATLADPRLRQKINSNINKNKVDTAHAITTKLPIR